MVVVVVMVVVVMVMVVMVNRSSSNGAARVGSIDDLVRCLLGVARVARVAGGGGGR